MTKGGDPDGAPPEPTLGPSGEAPRRPRAASTLALLLMVLLALFSGFVALGVWQIHRRAWKLDLIDRVERRVHAAPIPAPGPADWPAITRENQEYRHVVARGRYLPGRDTLAKAVTDLGEGYWVLTPLRTERGFIVLVNRGFVPPALRAGRYRRADGAGERVTVTGLLRISEPGGGFLRSNDPATGRWYSRDVAAIARARRLSDVAPYFIDADRQGRQGEGPVGGLTVVAFPNNHLVYAITWFSLAALSALAAGLLIRDERRLRKGGP